MSFFETIKFKSTIFSLMRALSKGVAASAETIRTTEAFRRCFVLKTSTTVDSQTQFPTKMLTFYLWVTHDAPLEVDSLCPMSRSERAEVGAYLAKLPIDGMPRWIKNIRDLTIIETDLVETAPDA